MCQKLRPHDVTILCLDVLETTALCDNSPLTFNAHAHPAHYPCVCTHVGAKYTGSKIIRHVRPFILCHVCEKPQQLLYLVGRQITCFHTRTGLTSIFVLHVATERFIVPLLLFKESSANSPLQGTIYFICLFSFEVAHCRSIFPKISSPRCICPRGPMLREVGAHPSLHESCRTTLSLRGTGSHAPYIHASSWRPLYHLHPGGKSTRSCPLH